jgi:hypothetical protein
MAKTMLRPDELAQAIMMQLRYIGCCKHLQNVVVTPVEDPAIDSNWEISGYPCAGAPPVAHDCKIEAMAAQERLRRTFDAIWPQIGH